MKTTKAEKYFNETSHIISDVELSNGKTYYSKAGVIELLEGYLTANAQLRSDMITLLEAYSLYLEKNGHMDIDWKTEAPYAIDEFLKSINKN